MRPSVLTAAIGGRAPEGLARSHVLDMASPAIVGEWLDFAVTYAPVVGVTAFGLAAASWQGVKFTVRKIGEISDRRLYGDEYHSLKLQAARDGCFDPSKISSLKQCIRTRTRGLLGAITSSLKAETLGELERLAPGSSRLRYQDILSGPPFLMPCSTQSPGGDRRRSVADYVLELEALFEEAPPVKTPALQRPKLLILGGAGDGKSLFCLRIRKAAASVRNQLRSNWCLQISASDFALAPHALTGFSDIGSRNWCGTLIALRLGSNNPTSLEIRLLGELLEKRGIILIDALDEISQRLLRSQMTTFLQSWALQHAVAVLARSSYYDSALKGAPEISNFDPIIINAPPDDARRAFVRAFCRRYGTSLAVERADEIVRSFDAFPGLSELAKKPLLLLMACELGVDGHVIGKTADVISIYEKFVGQFIERDIRRAHDEVAPRAMNELLQNIAWETFKERQEIRGDAAGIDISTLKRLIRDCMNGLSFQALERIEALLANCAIMSARPSGAGGEIRTFKFNHETFAEFLVAARLNDWLLGRRSEGSDFFETIESPGLSYYVKEYFGRLKLDAHGRQIARHRLFSLYEALSSKRQSSSDESAARMASFAAGQVAYYLGMIADGPDRAALMSAARSDPDFWVRRAAAIGLAFGGEGTAYDALIDDMRAGMTTGDLSLCRKHIAIELGFYGDQEFDRQDPTLDRGEPSCRRLVSRVAEQASFAIEQPNWRLDLFDLVYLANHRPASQDEFYAVLREVRPKLEACLRAIENVKRDRDYPEIAEVKAILEALGDTPSSSNIPAPSTAK